MLFCNKYVTLEALNHGWLSSSNLTKNKVFYTERNSSDLHVGLLIL